MDWCPCINMSGNDIVLYMVAFFNYTEVFSLLWFTTLTLQDFKNHVKFVTFWSALLTVWGFLWQTMKVFPSTSLMLIHITMLLFTVIISTRMKRMFIIIHWKCLHASFSGSSDVQLQKLWLLKGVCQIYFKLNFSKEKAYLKLKCELLWV